MGPGMMSGYGGYGMGPGMMYGYGGNFAGALDLSKDQREKIAKIQECVLRQAVGIDGSGARAAVEVSRVARLRQG